MNALPQALLVRSAGLAVHLAEAVLAKAVQDGASPARLAELGEALLAGQGRYRDTLLRLVADLNDELALLPDAPVCVAGDLREPGKGW